MIAVAATAANANPRSRSPASPVAVAYGTPIVIGTYSEKALAAGIKKSHNKYLACYNRARKQLDIPEGVATATATFTIASDGKVTDVDVSGLADVDQCVAGVLAKLTLAKPKDGAPVEVKYALRFYRPYPVPAGPQYAWLPDSESFGPRTPVSAPTISLGPVSVAGGLDTATVGRYVKRNSQKLSYCYEKELLSKPTLQGVVTAEFTIGADGLVKVSSAAGVDKQVEACVANVIKDIEFPKPVRGREVNVSYPITYQPRNTKPADAKPANAKSTQ
jgi:hypothetical protein